MICPECGNDEVCEGQQYCSDCLELLGHAADEPITNSSQAQPSDTPMPQFRPQTF